MADQSLTPNRRQFLSASAALPIALAIPAMAHASPRVAWDAAMARYIKARAISDAFNRDHYDVYIRRQNADHSYGIPDNISDRGEALIDEMVNAEGVLMDMPAPDRAALRWKLDIVLEPGEEFTPSYSANYVAQTIADYRRLLGDA